MRGLPSVLDVPRPVLKLFGEDGENPRPGGPGLSPAMRLTEFYRAFHRPVVLIARSAAPKNVKQYDESVGYWGRFTPNPPIYEIDDYAGAAFLTALSKLPGRAPGSTLSPNTVIKHCVHVQAVLDRTGPRSRDCPDAQRLLDEVPYLAKPKAIHKVPDDRFSIDEMTRILANCAAAVAPSELASAERVIWWQSLFLGGDYNIGLRIGSAMLAEWSMLRAQAHPEPADWLQVRTKGGGEKRIFVNQFARVAIEAMRPISGPGAPFGAAGRIWPWRNWPTSESWLHTNRRMILQAAGLDKSRWFGFHGFRKAMCSEAAAIDPLTATLQAGHKDQRTTIGSYVHPQHVMKAMRQLPQPTMPNGQKLLFET